MRYFVHFENPPYLSKTRCRLLADIRGVKEVDEQQQVREIHDTAVKDVLPRRSAATNVAPFVNQIYSPATNEHLDNLEKIFKSTARSRFNILKTTQSISRTARGKKATNKNRLKLYGMT